MDIKVDHNTVICFDLDDTLYNEIDFLRSGFKTIAMSLETQWQALMSEMFSLYRSGGDAFAHIENRYGKSITEQLELYRNHLPDIEAFQGVTTLLDAIVFKKGKICIITDGRSKTQRNKIKALGIESFIDKILISGETGHEKPHPHNFHLVQDIFPDHEYCYIGDNLSKDFIVPNQLNWQTICLLDRGRNIHNHGFEYASLIEYHPDHFIERMSDIKVI